MLYFCLMEDFISVNDFDSDLFIAAEVALNTSFLLSLLANSLSLYISDLTFKSILAIVL